MTAAPSAQGYGDGITHPATRPFSPQHYTMTPMTPLHPQTSHNYSHPARKPRHQDIVIAPSEARTDGVSDAVSVVKDNNTNAPLQPLSTLPHANGNTAPDGSSYRPNSSRQTPPRPPTTSTTMTTNRDRPPPANRSIYPLWPQRQISTLRHMIPHMTDHNYIHYATNTTIRTRTLTYLSTTPMNIRMMTHSPPMPPPTHTQIKTQHQSDGSHGR